MRELIAILVEMTDRGDWGRKVALVACESIALRDAFKACGMRLKTNPLGDLIAALTWPIDVAQELKEMADGPAVVTDYASLQRAQQEYKASLRRVQSGLGELTQDIGDAASNQRSPAMSSRTNAPLSGQEPKRRKGRAGDFTWSTYS